MSAYLNTRNDLLEPLTPHIWRLLRQTYWGEKINCYLIEDDGCLLIIDSPNYKKVVVDLFKSSNMPISIYLTHAAASGDGVLWQEKENVPMHLNSLDLSDRWLRGRPAKLFVGDLQLTTHVWAFHMPDHSLGHTMYYDQRDGGSLFTGDGILFNGNSWEIELTPEACSRLETLEFSRILPNHYNLLLEQAKSKVLAVLN